MLALEAREVPATLAGNFWAAFPDWEPVRDPVAGATVSLIGVDSTTVASTTADSGGNYSFAHVRDGQ